MRDRSEINKWKKRGVILLLVIMSAIGVININSIQADASASNALTTEEYAEFDMYDYDPYEFDEDSEWNPLGDYDGTYNSILYMTEYDCVGNQNYPTENYFLDMVSESSAEALDIDTMLKNLVSDSIDRYAEEYDEKTVYVKNSCGIDIDGDGIDELLEVSLVCYQKGNSLGMDQYNVYNEAKIYKLNETTGDYELLDASNNTMINYVASTYSVLMEIDSSMNQAFVSVAAGDYDNDGQEEAAIYVVDENAPYVMIVDMDENGMYESQRIYLKDIDTNFDGAYDLPIDDSLSVNLQTTQISGKDDLVINMSLSGTQYGSTAAVHSDLSHNSVTAIYRNMGSELGNIYKRVFDTVDGQRMRYVASIDGDVNGNGVEELIIGGHMEYDYTDGGNEIGSISSDYNGLFLLVWNQSTYSYEEVWSEPQLVEAHSEDILIYNTNVAPVAITSANYRSEATEVFLEGVVFEFIEYGTTGDTECDNLASGRFNQVYELDLDAIDISNSEEYFIDTATTAHFVSGEVTDQTVIITGTANKTNGYPVNYSIHWLWGEDGTVKESVNVNYMEDTSTSMLPSFLTLTALEYSNIEFNVTYIGKEYGWSEPKVYGVVKSLPYWDELVDLAISPGNITYSLDIGTGDEEAIELNDYINMSEEMAIKLSSEEYSTDPGVSEVLNHLTLWKAVNEYDADQTIEIVATEDTVILVATPIVEYQYEISLEGKTETISIYSQLPANYSTLTLEEYNRLVDKYSNLDLEIIEESSIYGTEVAGEPTSYLDLETWSTIHADGWVSENVISVTDTGVSTAQFTFDDTKTKDLGYGITYTEGLSDATDVTFSIDSKDGTIDYSTKVSTDSIYTTYANFAGITISGEMESLSKMTSGGTQAYYYLDGYYDYDIRAGVYVENGFYVLDYMVEGISEDSAPPKVPENFMVYKVSDTECMLMWETPESRLADEFVIVQLEDESGAYHSIATINGSSNQNYYVVTGLDPDTTYSFGIKAISAKETLTRATTTTDNSLQVISTWINATTNDSSDGENPTITTEASNVILTVDGAGKVTEQTATFEVVATAGTGYTDTDLSYQWERFDPTFVDTTDSDWVEITGAIAATYTIEVPADSIAYDEEGYYRVTVTQGTGTNQRTVTSKVVTLAKATGTLVEVGLEVTLSSTSDIYECDGLQFIDEGSTTTITAKVSGDNTSVINKMNGTVTFVGVNTSAQTIEKLGTGTITNGVATYTITSKDIDLGVYEIYAYYAGETVSADEKSYQVLGTISDSIEMDYGYTSEGILYRIIYTMNGGTNSSDNPSVALVDGDDITLEPALDKDDAAFEGWYTDAEFKYELKDNFIDVSELTSDLKLYAKYESSDYTITYNLDGGTNSLSNPDTYTDDILPFFFKDPVRIGYTFDGWYLDAEYEHEIKYIAKGTTGDIVVYAKWVSKSRTVTYSMGGGTNSLDNPTTYTVEDEDIALEIPTREGFYFKGWYIDPTYLSEIKEIDTDALEEIVIHARWSNYCEETTLEKSGDVYLIQDYDDLVEMARVVQADPYTYAYATYKITDTINCKGKTLEQPIGTETCPFNGTVYGNSNLIYNLVLADTEGTTGLFGVVGRYGYLTDILTCKIKYSGDADTVGALVGENYGIVDNCDTGIYVLGTMGYQYKSDNTILSGSSIVGGLVGVNHVTGSVINSSSSAQVTSDDIAGGLVGQNYGVVENGYNLGAIATTSTTGTVGGVVGVNQGNGTIFNVYHGGTVSGSEQCGTIIGTSTNTNFTMCYDHESSIAACSNQESDTTYVLAESVMKSYDFAETLNDNKDGTELARWMGCTWYNGNYPSIKSGTYVSTTYRSSKVTVSGVMLESAKVALADILETSQLWQQFTAAADTQIANGDSVLWAKEITVTHDEEEYLAANEGSILIQYEIPDGVVASSLSFWMVNLDGEIVEYKNESIEDGVFQVTLPYLATCAVVGELEEGVTLDDIADTGDYNIISCWVVLMFMMLFATGTLIYRRNTRVKED